MVDTLKSENDCSATREGASSRKGTKSEAGTTQKNSQRRYSSDEVADIIRIGLQNESGNTENGIDHEELISIGKEVGVSDEQIEIAVQMLEKEQQSKDKENLLWLRFKTHTAVFVGVNVLCFIINLVTGMDVFWSGYVLLGMGLFLFGHYAGLRYVPDLVQMATDRTRDIAISKYRGIVEDDVNVSFSVADPSGLMQSEGLLFLEEGKLVVEHQTHDAVLGIIKSAIKRTEISLDDITSIKLEPKFWSSELVLQGRSLRTFRSLPGASAGMLYLKINKPSYTAAANLVAEIKLQK